MAGLTNDDSDVLDNLVWHSLTTTHEPFALGDMLARRYDPEVTVFVGLESDEPKAWDALAELARAEETLIVFRAEPVHAPDGWIRHGGGLGNQMVLFDAPLDPSQRPDADIVALDGSHVPQMLALVELAQPGPFRQRTIEVGDYYGVFDDGGGLIAMAGERMQTSRFTEVSAVCTHPSERGRGLASALTHRVALGIRERGKTPILHVAQSNPHAQRVYERLGFVVRQTVEFAALQPPPDRC